MEAIFRKAYGALHPCDAEGRELLAKIRDGREVKVEVTQPRNPRHHRLYWAIVRFLTEHVEQFHGKDRDLVSTALKLAVGLVRVYVDKDAGTTIMVPKSISWGAMDQTKFAAFFDDACNVIVQRWMAGNTPEEIRNEILAMIEPNRSAA